MSGCLGEGRTSFAWWLPVVFGCVYLCVYLCIWVPGWYTLLFYFIGTIKFRSRLSDVLNFDSYVLKFSPKCKKKCFPWPKLSLRKLTYSDFEILVDFGKISDQISASMFLQKKCVGVPWYVCEWYLSVCITTI